MNTQDNLIDQLESTLADKDISRRAASLHSHQARGQLGKKWQHLRPPKRLANNDLTGCINAVDLKNALGQVEADCGNLHNGWLPFCS